MQLEKRTKWFTNPYRRGLVAQDRRHCLGVDPLDHRVRRGGQEAVHLMLSRHWPRLGAAITVERHPHAREREQRTLVGERQPDHVLFLRLRVWLRRVLGEAVGRDKAAVLSAEPRPPVW